MTHELSVISLCPAPPPWYTLITQNHCQKSETNFYSFFKSQLSEFCQVNETADPDLAPQGLTSLRKGLMEQFILSVKHGTGSVMGWDCFSASQPEWLAKNGETKNSTFYFKILRESLVVSPCSEAYARFSHAADNDLKNRPTPKWLENKLKRAL